MLQTGGSGEEGSDPLKQLFTQNSKLKMEWYNKIVETGYDYDDIICCNQYRLKELVKDECELKGPAFIRIANIVEQIPESTMYKTLHGTKISIVSTEEHEAAEKIQKECLRISQGIKNITNVMEKLTKNSQNSEKTINDIFDNIIINANKRRDILLIQLKDITNNKQNKLLNQQKIFKEKVKQLNETYNETQNMMKDTTIDIMKRKTKILSQSNQLLSEQIKITPKTNEKIKVILDVNNLNNILSSIGIICDANHALPPVIEIKQITYNSSMGSANEKHEKQIEELKIQITSIAESFQREKDALNNREKQIQQQFDKKIELLSAKNIQNKELYTQEFEKLEKANDKKLQRLEQQREQDRIKYENDLKQLQKKTIEITKKLEKDNLQSTTIHCINLINSNISLYKEKREKCMNIFNKYKDQLKEIKQEQNRLNKFFVQENKDKTLLNIVLIGITGHGKSSFGSRLLGDKSKECDGQISCIEKLCGDTENDHFKHNDNVDSETQNITKKIVRKVWKKDLSVTDTPGIFDTGGRDFNHSNSLVKFLKGCGGVNAFLLVKTRHPPRIDMAFKDSLRTLEMLLGRGFWKHVIMIITHTRGKDANKLKFQSYSQRFRETMLNDMNLQEHEAPLPFIGVDSFENYKEPIKQLIKIIPDKRFLCDELRSPLDEFRLKNKNVKIKFENMKSVLDEIKNTINIFKDELNLANTRLYEMDTDYIPKQVDVSELNESEDQWEIQIEDSYDNFDNLDAFDDFKTCDDENKEGIVHNEIIDWLIDNEEENVYFGTLDDDDDITVHLTDLSFKNPWTIELNKDSGNYVLLVETFKDLEDKGDDIQVTVKTIIYKRKDKQMETKTEHIVQNVMCAE